MSTNFCPNFWPLDGARLKFWRSEVHSWVKFSGEHKVLSIKKRFFWTMPLAWLSLISWGKMPVSLTRLHYFPTILNKTRLNTTQNEKRFFFYFYRTSERIKRIVIEIELKMELPQGGTISLKPFLPLLSFAFFFALFHFRNFNCFGWINYIKSVFHKKVYGP